MTSELKACPFCKRGATELDAFRAFNWELNSIEKWNERMASAPARSDAVARLVEACQALREQDDLWMAEPGDKGPCVEWHRRMVDMQVALAAVEKEMQ